MTDRKWTPGPWVGCNMVDDDGNQMTSEQIGEYVTNSTKLGTPDRFLFISGKHSDGGDCDVCLVGNGPLGPYNTALISAAPDLYEALDNLWSWVEGWNAEFMDDIEFDSSVYQKALAKARGEQ